MALTCTLGVDTASTVDGTTFTTGAFTPAQGDRLVACISTDTAASDVMTWSVTDSQVLGTGTSNKWSREVQYSMNSTRRNSIFVSDFTATNRSMTVTLTSSSSLTGAIITVIRVAGYPKYNSNYGTGSGAGATTPTCTMQRACLTGSAIIGMVQNGTNPATLTAPASYTERSDSGHATPTHGQEVVTRDSGETGSTITWGGTSASIHGELAIELEQGTVNDMAHFVTYGADTTYNVLRIYQPVADPWTVVDSSGNRPYVVQCAHNQWGSAGTDIPDANRDWQETFNYGCAGVFIQYRKRDTIAYPAEIQDVHAALQYIITNASTYKLDTTRVGAFGISAGAHLMAIAALTGGKGAVGGTSTPVGHIRAVLWHFGHNRFRMVDPAFTALSQTRSTTACCNAGPPWSVEANLLGSNGAPIQPCAQDSFDWLAGDSGALSTLDTKVENQAIPGYWCTQWPGGGTKPKFNLWHGDADLSIPWLCTHNPKTYGTAGTHARDNGFYEDLIDNGWSTGDVQYNIIAGADHNGDQFLPTSNPAHTSTATGAAQDSAVQWLLSSMGVGRSGNDRRRRAIAAMG